MMRSALLKLIGLPIIGILAFVVFLLAMFPQDHARTLVKRQLEKGLDYKYRVEMAEFDFGLISGIHMKGVTLSPRFEFEQVIPEGAGGAGPLDPTASVDNAPPDDDEPQYFCPDRIEPSPVMIDEIDIDPSLWAMIGGNIESDFELKTAGGTIVGQLGSGDEGGQTFAADIDGLFMQRFTLLRNMLEMHTIGRMSGSVDLAFGADASVSGGDISLDLGDVVLCPKTFKVNHPSTPIFPMPLTRLGDIAGTIEFTSQRRLEFKDFKGTGEDLDLEVQGFIQLATPQRPKMHWNLRINVTPAEEWEQTEMPLLKSMCQRRADGSYQFNITGPSGQVKFNCGRSQGGAPTGTMSRETRVSPPPTSASAVAGDAGYEEPVDDFDYDARDVEPEPYVIEDEPMQEMETPAVAARRSIPMSRNGSRAAELRKQGVKPIAPEARKELLNRAYPKRNR